MESLQKGTSYPAVTEADVKAHRIPLPSLLQQRRIVSILDEAFEGIATARANSEKNLQNARAIFDAQLKGVFRKGRDVWPERRLGDISEVQSGGTPLVSQKDHWGGNVPWYSSGELNSLTTRDPRRSITRSGLENSNAKIFPRGSLLIGMYDTAALKMSLLDRDAAFNQAIAGVKPNDDLDLEFVLYAITAVKSTLLLQRRGVRQKNLSLAKIKDITIPKPDIDTQRATVADIRRVAHDVDHLGKTYRAKLAALDALKKSLLHEAFSGNL
jgi:type I restriction enzyme S subunit